MTGALVNIRPKVWVDSTFTTDLCQIITSANIKSTSPIHTPLKKQVTMEIMYLSLDRWVKSGAWLVHMGIICFFRLLVSIFVTVTYHQWANLTLKEFRHAGQFHQVHHNCCKWKWRPKHIVHITEFPRCGSTNVYLSLFYLLCFIKVLQFYTELTLDLP